MNEKASVDRVVELVEAFTIDEEQAALDQALLMLEGSSVDATELIERLDGVRGDSDRKARAIIAIRARLGLSVVPGPVCRPRRLR